MHTITAWYLSVKILRMLECYYSVVAFSETSTFRRKEPPTFPSYPLSVFSIQQAIWNIIYVQYVYAQLVESDLHPSKFLAAASRNSKTVLYTLYVVAIEPMSLLIGALEGEEETFEKFVSLSGALLLASVASMTWILERRFLWDG